MSDMEALFRKVDELQPDELDELNRYIQQRRRATWWVVPQENLGRIADVMEPVRQDAERMSEDEISTAIDEALTEVRREQHQGRR